MTYFIKYLYSIGIKQKVQKKSSIIISTRIQLDQTLVEDKIREKEGDISNIELLKIKHIKV